MKNSHPVNKSKDTAKVATQTSFTSPMLFVPNLHLHPTLTPIVIKDFCFFPKLIAKTVSSFFNGRKHSDKQTKLKAVKSGNAPSSLSI